MTLATTTALLLSLVMLDDPTPRSRARAPRPVAMVLAVKGAVRVTPKGDKERRLAVEDLLYAGDRVAVSDDGTATIAVLGLGLRQTLRGIGTATLGPKGCEPSPLVESRELPRAVATTMKGVRPALGDARKAGVPIRGVATEPSAPIAPIDGATVDSLRPELAWRAREGVASYRVTLNDAAGAAVWKAEATGPRLAPSTERPELTRGEVYTWKVADPAGREVAAGHFTVADAEESRQLAELKPLASSKDPADLLGAAMSCDRLGFRAEAIDCLETLVKVAPDEPSYRSCLDRLRRESGRPAARQ